MVDRIRPAKIAIFAQREKQTAIDRTRLSAAAIIGAACCKHIPACAMIWSPADMCQPPAIDSV